MAKRSPILGYNHNIRHRGLVFHVQTEDSGVNNPHVFTHLFHGGVIITTRRLDYDPESAEEAVKSLMQAQHKAVLRELKRGEFSVKIDLYLGSNPDLLPFEREEDTEDDAVISPVSEPIASATDATQPIPTRPAAVADATRPVAVAPPPVDVAAPTVRPANRATRAAAATQPIASPPPPQRPAPRAPVVNLKPAPPPIDEPDTDPFVKHDVIVPRPADVSAAFDAIVANDVPVEVSDGTAQIHSPAPPSAPEPPGVRPSSPGSYSQHRPAPRGLGSPASEDSVTPPPVTPAMLEPDDRPTGRVPRMAQAPPPIPKGTRPKRSGVVVSRPAVIVGAPAKVIGGSPTPPATQPARPARTRKAAKPAADGLFGQGLISEKSLDEVILAYLSDDGSEE